MSWQSPDGDPPPASATPPPDAAVPEPDAETARVPLISAEPVGWTAPDADTTGGTGSGGGAPVDRPTVFWAAPSPTVAVPVGDGLVIAGTFSRVVAYSVDLLLLGALNLVIFGGLALLDQPRDDARVLIVSGVLVGIDFLYFVGLWTSRLQSTLGMRLLKLRVVGVRTTRTLSINDAVLRWISLSGAISILTLVPGLGQYLGLVLLLWILVLLISTSTNPLRQGLHDRWARSVVVQPGPGGSGWAIATCLVLVLLMGLILPIVFLAIAGDQLQEILSQIGTSI